MGIITALWLALSVVGITGLIFLTARAIHARNYTRKLAAEARQREGEKAAITLAALADEKRQRARDENRTYVKGRLAEIEAAKQARRERQLAQHRLIYGADKAGNA